MPDCWRQCAQQTKNCHLKSIITEMNFETSEVSFSCHDMTHSYHIIPNNSEHPIHSIGMSCGIHPAIYCLLWAPPHLIAFTPFLYHQSLASTVSCDDDQGDWAVRDCSNLLWRRNTVLMMIIYWYVVMQRLSLLFSSFETSEICIFCLVKVFSTAKPKWRAT